MPNTHSALVVSQDPDVAACTAARLRTGGFMTLTATSSRDAMRQAVERQPAVIVLDASMPEVDSPEAVRWLQDQDETYGIPVVFISSGRAEDGTSRNTVQHWMRRPFKPGQLVDTVNRAIKSAKQKEALSLEMFRQSSDCLRRNIARVDKETTATRRLRAPKHAVWRASQRRFTTTATFVV